MPLKYKSNIPNRTEILLSNQLVARHPLDLDLFTRHAIKAEHPLRGNFNFSLWNVNSKMEIKTPHPLPTTSPSRGGMNNHVYFYGLENELPDLLSSIYNSQFAANHLQHNAVGSRMKDYWLRIVCKKCRNFYFLNNIRLFKII